MYTYVPPKPLIACGLNQALNSTSNHKRLVPHATTAIDSHDFILALHVLIWCFVVESMKLTKADARRISHQVVQVQSLLWLQLSGLHLGGNALNGPLPESWGSSWDQASQELCLHVMHDDA